MATSSIVTALRLALRLMRRRPLFNGLLILVLASGVGFTTGVFSLVQAFVVQPLPYPHAEELTAVWRSSTPGERLQVSLPQFLDWKARATTVTRLAASGNLILTLTSASGDTETLPSARVSGDFFPLLGLPAQLGRLLGPDDDREGGPPVAVISDALWQQRFAADPAIVGQRLIIDGQPHEVVGVAPRGFAFGDTRGFAVDLWLPLSLHRGYRWLRSSPQVYNQYLLGRRAPGVSLAAVEAELSELVRSSASVPADGARIVAQDLQRAVLGELRIALVASLAAAALIFLMVCSNVSGLLMMQAYARRGEFALRAALGATRGHLLRQSLGETLVPFLAALPLSLGVASLTFALAASGSHDAYPAFRDVNVAPDARGLTFCLVFSLACGVLAGSLPALLVSRGDLQSELASAGTRASAPASLTRLRALLVVAQVAIAFTLLIGAGSSWRSLGQLRATPLGFEARGLAAARLFNIEDRYPNRAERRAFYERVMAALERAPGVLSVAANEALPMGRYDGDAAFTIAERPGLELPSAPRNVITPGYFGTMQTPLLLGRGLQPSDDAGSTPVALINQELMERYFAGESPLGRHISHPDHDGGQLREIVGVVGNVHRRGPAAPVVPETYLPYRQSQPGAVALVIRAEDPARVVESLPAWLAAIDPALESRQWSIAADVLGTIRDYANLADLLRALAAIAVLIASINLYTLIAYLTAQRTRELGIRIALGAAPSALLWLVVRGSLKWLAAGALLGATFGVTLCRELEPHFPHLEPFDPAVFGAVTAIIALTGSSAALLAALKALRIPPASALRYE